MQIDVEPTAKHIDEMARILRASANSVERYANSVRDKNDVTYAAEVMNEVVGMINNLRLYLLVIRPTRAMENKKDRPGQPV